VAESFIAQVAWLVCAGVASAALSPGERAARQDALDDQVVLLSQIIRVRFPPFSYLKLDHDLTCFVTVADPQAARQTECRQRVHDLRSDLLAIRSVLTHAATMPAPAELEPHTAQDTRGHDVELVGAGQRVGTDGGNRTTIAFLDDDGADSSEAAPREGEEVEAAPTDMSRDADESLLRGGSDDDDHDDHSRLEGLPQQQQLHRHHRADQEETDVSNADVEREDLSSGEEAVDAFAQMMDRLGQYGSGLQQSLAECTVENSPEELAAAPLEALIPVADVERQSDSYNRETQLHGPATGEEDEMLIAVAQPDPRCSISSPPSTHHARFADESPREEEEIILCGSMEEEVSRALFLDEEEEEEEQEEGPPASSAILTGNDQVETDSAPFRPATSAEPSATPHPAHHSHTHSHPHPRTHDAQTESSALAAPTEPTTRGVPLAPPLSSSMVADLVSSVGGESQSVDFSHYIHRAYEVRVGQIVPPYLLHSVLTISLSHFKRIYRS